MANTTTNGREAILGDVSPTITLDVDKIICDYSINARNLGNPISAEDVKDLAASIAEDGLIQVPAVWERVLPPAEGKTTGKVEYQVIAGFRRFTAITKVLGWKKIDVKCIAAKTLAEAKLKNLVENTQRQDLRPFELASACVDLKKNHNFTGKEIGLRVGKSKGNVNNLIRAHENLHPSILKEWKKREYPIDDFVRLATMDHEEQLEAFAALTSEIESESEEDGTDPDGKKKRSRGKRAKGELAVPRMLRREILEKYLLQLRKSLKNNDYGTVLLDGEYQTLDGFSTAVAIVAISGALGLQRRKNRTTGLYEPIAFFAEIGMEPPVEEEVEVKAKTKPKTVKKAAKKTAKKTPKTAAKKKVKK